MFNFSGLLLFSVLTLQSSLVTSAGFTLKIADRLFEKANYHSAITEYKRYIFFNQDSDSRQLGYAYYKIGVAYRNQKKWPECLAALQKSIRAETQNELQDERKIALAVALMANRSYPEAEYILLKVETFSPSPQLRQRASFFRGVSSIYRFKWKEASEAFQNYFSEPIFQSSTPISSNRLFGFLHRAQTRPLKSASKAKWMSTFLPGAGQIYAEDWRGGINALVLNVFFGYFFASDLLNGQYLNALSNSLFQFGRFYLGNRTNAEKAAQEHNRRSDQKYAEQILNVLKEN